MPEHDRFVPRHLPVLHVTAPAPVGGLERVVTELAAGFRARGVDHRVAVVLDRPDPEHPFVAGLRRRSVPVQVHVLPARAYRAERRVVLEACRRDGPAILHTHGFRSDILHWRTARRAGAACVSTLHGFIGSTWRGRVYEALQVRRLRRFDGVVAVSRPIVARVERAGVPPGRLHLVPNAIGDAPPLESVAARVRLGLEPGRRVVGFVGRLTTEKGADVWLATLALLPADLHAVIIGDGPERPTLERQRAALGLSHRVRFAGNVPEAGSLLPAFDMLVLSSRTEGTPMILLEAMSAGVPVVATEVGGVPDVLGIAEGWLVPPDQPPALAAAILDRFHDPSAAQTRADRARARVRRECGVEQWLDRYEQVYSAAWTAARGQGR